MRRALQLKMHAAGKHCLQSSGLAKCLTTCGIGTSIAYIVAARWLFQSACFAASLPLLQSADVHAYRCGVGCMQYGDEEDMQQSCPGEEEDAH